MNGVIGLEVDSQSCVGEDSSVGKTCESLRLTGSTKGNCFAIGGW